MAVQSLYRKWRSQTLTQLVGQEHVVRTLRHAILEDRIAHAYLFTGPRGVGKTSMARLLAKAANCEAPPEQRPCGECASCAAIADGRAVDVIEMDAASHTSVDDARDLIERVQFRPASGRYKVYVIDEVHMLSTAAFNALLKTLEEPPDHAIFILATTEVHKIPATILSRCQRFTFTRHTIADIANHLTTIATHEGLSLASGVAEAIARAATGSMRDALGVLEQLGSFTAGQVELEHVYGLLGMTNASEVDALVDALVAGDLTAALQLVNRVADQGLDIRQYARDLTERLRLLLLYVAAGSEALPTLGEDEFATLQGWAGQSNVGSLVHWIKLISGLDYQLRTTPYGHLPLELAIVEALVRPAAPAAPAPARPAAPAPAPFRPPPARKPAPPPPATEQQPSADPQPEPADSPSPDSPSAAPPHPDKAPPAPPAPPAIHAVANELNLFDKIEAAWGNIVRDVRPHNNRLEAVLRSVYPVDVEGSTLLLQAASPFHKEQTEKARNRQIIEDVVYKHVHERLTVSCTVHQADAPQDMRDKLREARKDPRYKAALNIFSPVDVRIAPDESSAEDEL